MSQPRAIIIGAGPAGLTAAHELITRTGIHPVVLDMSDCVGGISRTVNYKGNRLDIGGHRFFSKSGRVMEWWLRMLPLNGEGDRTMLVRQRRSRIYYLRRFFSYPITLSRDTLAKLGLWRVMKIGASYMRSALFPLKPEDTLERFFINRFGRELYRTFFQSYTEKVWGVPCSQINAAWGAQRVKGLSIVGAVTNALKKWLAYDSSDIAQKGTETSLIDQFLYPKYGPGQMWEEAARRITAAGGEINFGWRVIKLITDGWRVTGVEAECAATGERKTFAGDYVFSTAPVSELVRAFDTPPPANVLEVAKGLVYRDFITVGLLAGALRIHEETAAGRKLLRDNWIYIQEPDVQVGRLQVFNNWSPHMVADPSTVWLGLEYFCNQTDAIWNYTDAQLIALATEELGRIGIVDAAQVLDGCVLRMEKTYPAYFGTYDRFHEIREYVDRFENLFLIGRNGMHRYNNQDHSMLTAMMVVDGIIAGRVDRAALWEVNTETDYHEEKTKEP